MNNIRLMIIEYCANMGWLKDPYGCNDKKDWNSLIILSIIFSLFTLIISIAAKDFDGILFSIFMGIIILSSPIKEGNTKIKGFLIQKNGKYDGFNKLNAKQNAKTKLTKEGARLKAELCGYIKYLDKVKINTKTEIIDDGTLSHRIAINNGTIRTSMIESLKKYKINDNNCGWEFMLLGGWSAYKEGKRDIFIQKSTPETQEQIKKAVERIEKRNTEKNLKKINNISY